MVAEKCGLSEATLSRVMGRKRGKEVGSSEKSKFPASLLSAEANEQLQKLYSLIETGNPMAVERYHGSRIRPPRLLATSHVVTQACLDRLSRAYYGMDGQAPMEWEAIWADWIVGATVLRGPLRLTRRLQAVTARARTVAAVCVAASRPSCCLSAWYALNLEGASSWLQMHVQSTPDAKDFHHADKGWVMSQLQERRTWPHGLAPHTVAGHGRFHSLSQLP